LYSITCLEGPQSPVHHTAASLKIYWKKAIRSKHHGLLTSGVLLQHDNAQPKIACATAATIEDMQFQCLPHPSDSQTSPLRITTSLGHLKRCLVEPLSDPTEAQETVYKCLLKQPKYIYFSGGIKASVKHWKKCIERNGDYVFFCIPCRGSCES